MSDRRNNIESQEKIPLSSTIINSSINMDVDKKNPGLENSLNNQKEKQKKLKVNMNITQEIILETISLKKKMKHAERMKRYRERKKIDEGKISIRNKLSGMTDEEKRK